MSNPNIQEFLEKNKSIIGEPLVLLRCKNEEEYIIFSNLNNKPALFGFIIETNIKNNLIPKFKAVARITGFKDDPTLVLLNELTYIFDKTKHSILIDRINFFDLYV